MFDGVKQRYQDIKTTVKHKIQGVSEEGENSNNETVAALSNDDADKLDKEMNRTKAKSEPEKFPETWKTRTVIEPIFDSGLFMVETGKQHKNTIVLVHGLGSLGLRDWKGIIPILEKNFHVIAVDLPGFGNSGRPKGRYSPTNYAKVLHWVIDRYAKDEVYLVGHSMGGAVSLRYASMYPKTIKKVILVDAAGILERTSFIKHMSSIPVDLTKVPSRFKKMVAYAVDFSQSFVEMTALNHDISCVVQNDQDAWDKAFANKTNANAGLALVSENFSDAVEVLNVPLFMIWGDKDKVAPLRTGKLLEGTIKGSQLAVIKGAGHVPMKSHPDQFIGLLGQAIMHKSQPEKKVDFVETDLDLNCKKEVGKTYSGNYRNIKLDHCTAIKLFDVYAKSIEINESTVELENVTVDSTDTAIDTTESVVTITASNIKGLIPIYSSGSRLDIAGTTLSGYESAIDVGVSSRMILSISKYKTETISGNLHGFYNFANGKLLDNLDENHSQCK